MVMPPNTGQQEANAIAKSVPAERYDRFVRLAQALFGAPMAALNLIGNDKQFTVSSVGFPKGEIPVEDSVCHVTVLEDQILEVRDLREDNRFAAIPAVVDAPRLRFYAGVPVRGQSGQNIGALCILDLAPRTLGPQQRQLLGDLGALLEYELTVQKEMDLVGQVQQLMLPASAPDIDGIEIAGRLHPAKEAGGDYFDWMVVDDPANGGKRLQVVLGDVMGKGLSASLFASEARAVMRGHAPFTDIGEAVARTFATTGRDFEANDRFSTLWVGRMDPITGTLDYVDAGHGLAIIVSKDRYRRLDQDYLPIGPLEDTWSMASDFLAEDELLIIMSDGLFDVVDDSFGELEARLRLVYDLKMSCRRIVDTLVTFAISQGATDDVTVLAIRRIAELDATTQGSAAGTT
ncbi:MAG: SpoIIE family protein phosphatase [Acidimicrobiaceae bacterium]|nr:SpoIIE family protein phosphatase [Acidimicrobiaceae bacterium]